MREFVLGESDVGLVCNELYGILEKGDVVLLRGDLGVGKTTFVREFVRAECLERAKQVSSPTFTLVQNYESEKFGMIYHYDLYRKSLQEMLSLGLLDMLQEEGVHFVEWGSENLERILKECTLRVACLEITQNPQSLNFRNYKVGL